MFHANGWGTVFSAPMVGARLVLPGPWLDGESVYNLMRDFSVNFSVGVPTVWLNLLSYMDANDLRPTTLKNVCIGGSAGTDLDLDLFIPIGIWQQFPFPDLTPPPRLSLPSSINHHRPAAPRSMIDTFEIK